MKALIIILTLLITSCSSLEDDSEKSDTYNQLYDRYALMIMQKNTVQERFHVTQDNYRYLNKRYEQLEARNLVQRKELQTLYIDINTVRESMSSLKIHTEKINKEKSKLELDKSTLEATLQKLQTEKALLHDHLEIMRIKFIALETYNEQIQKRHDHERNDNSVRGEVPQSNKER